MFPQPYAMAAPGAPAMGLEVRPVTAANYESELDQIGSLLPQFPIIVFDTEYPGTVHRPPPGRSECDLTPPERYTLIKANIDEVPILQLGITLCDADGNVPIFSGAGGTAAAACYERAWVFTFSDFDARRDRHAPESVAFLRSRGVDLDAARAHGVSSTVFAARFAAAVLAPARISAAVLDPERRLTWAAYGGAYDFAYMVKMLSGGRPLPGTWHEFMARARELLGRGGMFDAKYMAEHSGLIAGGGGLRGVAAWLGVETPLVPEPPFLAGPKCRAACRVYTAMRRYFRELYLGLPLPWQFVCHDHAACFDGLIDGFH
ncbi:unnamed protein product [Urochloa humidicola]